MQAAAYGLAIQKAWPVLRVEWRARAEPVRSLPTVLATCELICAAPDGYWQMWLGDEGVRPGAWGVLAKLRAAFAARGLPSTLINLGDTRFGEIAPAPVQLPRA